MKRSLLLGVVGVLAVVMWQAGIPWWASQHQPGLSIGSQAVVSLREGEYAFGAQSPDDMGKALAKLGHGTHLNAVDSLAVTLGLNGGVALSNGDRVRILELGRTGNVMLARIEVIGRPSNPFVPNSGWVVSDWLTSTDKQRDQ